VTGFEVCGMQHEAELSGLRDFKTCQCKGSQNVDL